MTPENLKILQRINIYAEKVLGDINPQETPVSEQLEALKPIMQEISDETGMSLMDVFILYMDLASEAGVVAEQQFKENMGQNDGFSGIANRLQ